MRALIIFCCGMTCIFASTTPKFALVVGINEYKNKEIPALQGCINDAFAMQSLLREQFQFEEVALLQNATSQEIKDQLQYFLRKTQEAGGSKFVLFFSGHGATVADENFDEADGLDEVLITHDTVFETYKGAFFVTQNYISDDYLDKQLQDFSRAGAHTTVIFDCCHSGTGIRDLENNNKQLNLHVVRGKRGEDNPPPPGSVFISACLPSQITTEEKLPDGSTGGLLTYHFIHAVKKLARKKSDMTYHDVFLQLRKMYSRKQIPAVPTIEGNVSKKLFDSRCQAKRTAKVLRVLEDNRVELNRGAYDQVTKGSLYALTTGSKHPLVVVDKVDAISCQAHLIDESEWPMYRDLIPAKKRTRGKRISRKYLNGDAVELLHNGEGLQLRVSLKNEKGKHVGLAQLQKNFPTMYHGLNEYIQQNVIRIVKERTQTIIRFCEKHIEVVWVEGKFEKNTRAIYLGHEDKENLQKTLRRFNKIRNLLNFNVDNFAFNLSCQVTSQNKTVWSSKEIICTPQWRQKISSIKHMRVNPKKRQLAFVDGGQVYLYDVYKKQQQKLRISDKILRICFSKDGRLFCMAKKKIWIMDRTLQKLATSIAAQKEVFTAIAVKNDMLFVTTSEGKVQIWRWNPTLRKEQNITIGEYIDDVMPCDTADNFAVSSDESLYVYRNGKKMTTLPGGRFFTWCNGNLFYCHKGYLQKWSDGTPQNILPLRNPKYLNTIGKNYVVFANEEYIKVFDCSTQKVVWKIEGEYKRYTTHPKYPYIFAYGEDDYLYMWNLLRHNGKSQLRFTPNQNYDVEIANASEHTMYIYSIFMNSDYSIHVRKEDDILAQSSRSLAYTIALPKTELFRMDKNKELDQNYVQQICKQIAQYYPLSTNKRMEQQGEIWRIHDSKNQREFTVENVKEHIVVSVSQYGQEWLKIFATTDSRDMFPQSIEEAHLPPQKYKDLEDKNPMLHSILPLLFGNKREKGNVRSVDDSAHSQNCAIDISWEIVPLETVK
ncbi:caspase family protein [Candidatus Uabimicrobium amorphum]|uniref:Peptidase C14 n=1 Tax=Uabimicrobium amorphum TaxID=2596890 RepID=A0A5S9IQH9_UABAM|nr:caspase family protein [Candidatus Uabimicrobium amorphum]BBM86243.1 peptidase C14 [Candidatus Uabimicrobium amorphum]